MAVKNFNVVSLFSGVGGMDLGFKGGFDFLGSHYESHPFNIIFANDIFKQAADMHEYNFNIPVERRSIVDLDMDSDLPDVPVDVVIGGFPCQTFSLAGKRKGLDDPRGQLYLQMIRVIDHYKPKMFIAENVDGIRTANNGEQATTALTTIISEFKEHGYDVTYKVLLAADYGVPQMRKRVIIVGVRSGLGSISDFTYPQPVNDSSSWVTCYEALEDLWGKVGITEIPNHTSKDISGAKFYPGRKMQGNNKVPKNAPGPTIRAEHHGNIEAHYNTTLDDPEDMSGWRRLSVRECARIQSFPDTYNFKASASSAYKGIGNAVPPVMAWYIAKSVADTLSILDSQGKTNYIRFDSVEETMEYLNDDSKD